MLSQPERMAVLARGDHSPLIMVTPKALVQESKSMAMPYYWLRTITVFCLAVPPAPYAHPSVCVLADWGSGALANSWISPRGP